MSEDRWVMSDEGSGMKDQGWGMKDETCGMSDEWRGIKGIEGEGVPPPPTTNACISTVCIYYNYFSKRT